MQKRKLLLYFAPRLRRQGYKAVVFISGLRFTTASQAVKFKTMEIKNKPVFTFVKGNTPPKDWTVTFSCDNPKQVVVLHIPFEDLSTVAHLFNTFLNENGVKSYIEEQTGTTTVN